MMFLHLCDILEERIERKLQIVSLYSTLIQSRMLFEICITLSTQERILAEYPSFSLSYNEREWGLEPSSSKKHYKSSQSDAKI